MVYKGALPIKSSPQKRSAGRVYEQDATMGHRSISPFPEPFSPSHSLPLYSPLPPVTASSSPVAYSAAYPGAYPRLTPVFRMYRRVINKVKRNRDAAFAARVQAELSFGAGQSSLAREAANEAFFAAAEAVSTADELENLALDIREMADDAQDAAEIAEKAAKDAEGRIEEENSDQAIESDGDYEEGSTESTEADEETAAAQQIRRRRRQGFYISN